MQGEVYLAENILSFKSASHGTLAECNSSLQNFPIPPRKIAAHDGWPEEKRKPRDGTFCR
jgi:hypothetical protein